MRVVGLDGRSSRIIGSEEDSPRALGDPVLCSLRN
jgi:hypothetical protein